MSFSYLSITFNLYSFFSVLKTSFLFFGYIISQDFFVITLYFIVLYFIFYCDYNPCTNFKTYFCIFGGYVKSNFTWSKAIRFLVTHSFGWYVGPGSIVKRFKVESMVKAWPLHIEALLGSTYVVLAVLELTKYIKLAWYSQRSACLCYPSAEIKGVC